MGKAKKYLTSALLLLSFPILMASSRDLYQPYTSHYEGFDLYVEKKESEVGVEGQLFEFTFRNTGYGLIDKSGAVILRSSSGYRERLTPVKEEAFSFGESMLLKPGGEMKVLWREMTDFNEFTKDRFDIRAYIGGSSGAEYSGGGLVTTGASSNYYLSQGTITGQRTEPGVRYCYAVTMDYEDTEYCFLCSRLDEEGHLSFYASNGFEPDKATIKEVVSFEYEEYRTNYAGYALGGIVYIGMFILIAHLIIGAIILIIVLSVRAARKRRRNNAQ